MTLYCLPGGRIDTDPLAGLSPVRRRFVDDLEAATVGLRPVNVLLRVPADDMRLLLAALAAPGVNSRLTAIGRALWPQVHPSLLPPSADDADPHGLPRPVLP